MTDKVDHVRSAKQTRAHKCHWPGCTRQVPPAMWGCRPHWFKLPGPMRAKIWRTYSPGQEERMDPSAAYLEAAREVDEWARASHGTLDVKRPSTYHLCACGHLLEFHGWRYAACTECRCRSFAMARTISPDDPLPRL